MKEQDRQAALDALARTNKRLEIFKEHNSGIPEKDLMREFAQNEGVYWEDLEPIINAAKDQLDQYREDINADAQAALDTFPDGMNYQGQYVWDWFIKNSTTIRAALTAQLTKTDDNVSCPRVANAGDINAEMLEALKEIKYKSESHLNNGLGDFAGYISDIRMIVTEAIAIAEQKGGK